MALFVTGEGKILIKRQSVEKQEFIDHSNISWGP